MTRQGLLGRLSGFPPTQRPARSQGLTRLAALSDFVPLSPRVNVPTIGFMSIY